MNDDERRRIREERKKLQQAQARAERPKSPAAEVPPPLDDATWEVYVKLWKRAEEHASVRYDGMAPFGEAGWFDPNDEDGEAFPAIYIERPYYDPESMPSRHRVAGAPPPPPDLLDELCTLAHEYGHSCEWRVHRTVAYKSAVERMRALLGGQPLPPLSDDEKHLIRAEEQRAWRRGREALAALGFAHWTAYDAKERAGLDEYERIFAGKVGQ
jgi:hypothetical protein